MKRRDFLSGAAITGAATATTVASALSTPAIAQDRRELKLVTTWPKNFPGLGTSAERWAQRITAMSDGRLTVKVYAAGELVPAFEAFDAVSSGTADMYHGAEYYWQGKSKAFNFFAAVPFGLTATEINAWVYHAGGQQLWDELSAGFNIKPMLVANTGVQMGGWFNKEINAVEDYKGLKIRIPGLGGEVLRRIGAAAVSLPGGEVFPALQSGAIDATEWVGPWNDLAFGFYKVAKYYYYPGFHEPGTALSGGVNLAVWDSLSDADKAIIEAAAAAENDYTLAEFNTRNGDALATLVNEHGVELRKFSDDIMKAIGDAAGEVVAEVAAEDPMTKKVYDSFIDFRTKAVGWARIADQAYWTARELPYAYGQ
ncbi:TRAP transporter substrate-binding protein [Roseospira visakhapatnamensis]|uniref:TRAP-type mannitol/chloroaromatic compound transport system substrate-binding protein n=1 Tax=Roseospira visakhapatnamensis TaxID=390880 RepID=A0A7W6RER8_9PROT|nr:TRAP transporter substrate-binding protein [Roseospira visakhapatnamensis]MBB4267015.1 TRAP-type mannitol/chloroaromatic compound transport system substrate-binding protein [Roseospira visakhapatnamensis]